jgi:single-stranded-DNA-specific exonuclease
VDGVTSAALLGRFLENIGCEVQVHVPHRMKEGYGIHLSAVHAAIEWGAQVFLTCDCGVSAFEQLRIAREAGMRVVVTDHHEVGPEMPEVDALVNPHRRDSRYPFSELSGVGVAFKLGLGIAEEAGFERRHYLRAFLDLATLGTVADVMPLVGENRLIVRHGLPLIAETKKVGLRALLAVSRKENSAGPVGVGEIGFHIGPRINAAGRIDDAALALELLLTRDDNRAHELAAELDRLNTERREKQNAMIDDAIARLEAEGRTEDSLLFVSSSDYHAGLVGLIAGRLVERYHRPAFVAVVDLESGIARASARTIPPFHVQRAIEHHRPLLLTGGGHHMAGGLSVRVEHLDQLAAEMREYAADLLQPDDLVPHLQADVEVAPEEVNERTVAELARLQPCGMANPEPVFVCRDLALEGVKDTKNPEHAMPTLLAASGKRIYAKAWRMAAVFERMALGTRLDVAFKPKLESFNGREYLNWILEDVRPAE